MANGDINSAENPIRLLWDIETVQRNKIANIIDGNVTPFVHMRFGRVIPFYNVQNQHLTSFKQSQDGSIVLTFVDPTNFLFERLLRYISTYNQVEDFRTVYLRWGWTNGIQHWTQGGVWTPNERIQNENTWVALTMAAWAQSFPGGASQWTLELSPLAQYIIDKVRPVVPSNMPFDKINQANFESMLRDMFINQSGQDPNEDPLIKVEFTGTFDETSLAADDGWYQTKGDMPFKDFISGIVQRRWKCQKSGMPPRVTFSSSFIEESGSSQSLCKIMIYDEAEIEEKRVNANLLLNEQLGLSNGAIINDTGNNELNDARNKCSFFLKYPSHLSGVIELTVGADLQWTDFSNGAENTTINPSGETNTLTSESAAPNMAGWQKALVDKRVPKEKGAAANVGEAGRTSSAPNSTENILNLSSYSPYYAIAVQVVMRGEPDIYDADKMIGQGVYLEVNQQPMLDQQLADGRNFTNTAESLQRNFPILQALSANNPGNELQSSPIIDDLVRSGLFDPNIKSHLNGVYCVQAWENDISGGDYKTTLTLMPILLLVDQ